MMKIKSFSIQGYFGFKNKVSDIAAATSLEGRKICRFGLFEEVLKVLKILSIDQFNLGSLTSQNRGVNDFKIGTGAKELLYVGELNIVILNI